MSEKHLVCQGATCKCQFGTTPDKLKVKTQSKRYINEMDGSKKLVATHKDTGQTFEQNNFGSCKKLNNNPCKVNVTEWQGFYQKVTLEDNNGHPLLEDSKAICAIGGNTCIEITNHGQTSEISVKNADNTSPGAQVALNPLLNMRQVGEDVELVHLKICKVGQNRDAPPKLIEFQVL